MVTTVAADDLEGVPVAAFLTAFHDAGRLAPEADCDAMPGLTSQRDSPDVSGLNAAPRITGVASALRADVLRIGSRPGTGQDIGNFGVQLNPASVGSATAGVWSSITLYATMVARSMRRQVLDLSWIVTTNDNAATVPASANR
jgi:hypothetical protein